MKIGLSMIVKNEAENLKKYLPDIIDLFEDIVIIDTGSTDDSIQILKEMGIQAITYEINHSDQRLIDARNYSIEKNKSDWVLILDGDERISKESLKRIRDFNHKDQSSGYFLKRINYKNQEAFEDYKMSIINKNKVRFLFSVHACPQTYIRDSGGRGSWLNGPWIDHYPVFKPDRSYYIEQMKNGIRENPTCLRYYWFLGYHYFMDQDYTQAIKYLAYVIENKNYRFPVEILNSIIIISTIYQKLGNSILSFYYVNLGCQYFHEVQKDFEVQINFRMPYRLTSSREKLLQDPNAELKPYSFGY